MDLLKSEAVALILFDQMVNRGPRTALNAALRGFALKYLVELNELSERDVVNFIAEESIRNYNAIVERNPSQKVFLRGWMNRIHKAKTAALELLKKEEDVVRKIEVDMIKFFDEKLKLNGLAQQAIKEKNPRLLMIEAAKVCVGIREKSNKNDGPMVELIQETIGSASGEAWCMSFVQTCIAYAEFKTGIHSRVEASEHCLTTWNRTSKMMRVKSHPLPGAIAIWRHGTSTSGHTGIVLGADQKIFQAVEGNTSEGKAGDKIVREGGGVYFTERSMQKFPEVTQKTGMILVGFLKPF
jgi:hypothetical protein